MQKYFFGTATRIEGVGLDQIAKETVTRHARAFGTDPTMTTMLTSAASMPSACAGEAHVWTAGVIAGLQHAVRANSFDQFQKEFSDVINAQSQQALTIRGLFRIKSRGNRPRTPVPLDEVEPAQDIVKRFATGAMSYGSISREAHTNLAIAMKPVRRTLEHR